MKFSLPFFRRKQPDAPRSAQAVLPPQSPVAPLDAAPVTAAPAEETRSRWELAAEQLASMNGRKEEVVAPAPVPVQPAESVEMAVPSPAVQPPAPLIEPPVAVVAVPETPVPELVVSAFEEPAVAPPPVAAPVGMTRDDVVAAFRLFLRRDPESEAVIEPYLGRGRERLLGAFLTSAEFLQWPEHLRLIVEVAQVIERRQLAPPPRAGVPTLSAQDLEAVRRILQPTAPAQEIEPSLEGQPVDWALACLMRSDAFQRNPFNARLVTGLAREIAGQLKPQTDSAAGAAPKESLSA